jgi:hypothetical protein
MRSLLQNIKWNIEQCGELSPETILLLKRKINNLRKIIGDAELLGWGKTIEQYPETLLDETVFNEMKNLFLPKFAIHYHKAAIENQIYYKKSNKFLPAVRNEFSLIFENPISKKVESWSRIKSLSHDRKDHWPGSVNRNKSKFLKKKDIKELEFVAYSKGKGLLTDQNKLFLYYEFNVDIGKLKKTGRKSKLIKVECVRLKRNIGSGYKVNIHGYPISIEEMEKDFGLGRNKIKTR